MTNTKRIAAGLFCLVGLLIACGGGNGQSMNCGRYLACVAKFTGSSASLDSTYGQSGTCWMDTRAAESCDIKCKMSLAAFPSDAGC